MPSVIEAPINRAEASSSFWPFSLLRRVVERTQISRGMLKMRTNVMEFGKFTVTSAVERKLRTRRCLIILHAPTGTQWTESRILARTKRRRYFSAPNPVRDVVLRVRSGLPQRLQNAHAHLQQVGMIRHLAVWRKLVDQ